MGTLGTTSFKFFSWIDLQFQISYIGKKNFIIKYFCLGIQMKSALWTIGLFDIHLSSKTHKWILSNIIIDFLLIYYIMWIFAAFKFNKTLHMQREREFKSFILRFFYFKTEIEKCIYYTLKINYPENTICTHIPVNQLQNKNKTGKLIMHSLSI